VICPNCREDNAPTFRFCGMCGTSLEPRVEARRPAGAPVPILPPNLPKIAHAPEPMRPVVMENATKPSNSPQSSLGGPSVLGLDQPGGNQPSTDVLRERAFSGLDSFFEPEQPKTSGRRILLMVALLAALGGAAWWTYTNYLGATEGRKPEPATSNADEASAEKPSTHAAGTQDAAPAAGSPQAVVASDLVVTAGPILRIPHATIQPGWLGEGAFASLVDFDSYWHPDALREADKFCTDDEPQLYHYRDLGYFQNIPAIHADLGELITGRKPGREKPEERTLACNLGLALDDIAVAPLIYERALEKGIGTWLPL